MSKKILKIFDTPLIKQPDQNVLMYDPLKYIAVFNAREKNLKNVSVRIPKNQLVVLTGPSGSGKTTLAFGTLYAEGKRRYIESLSTYARQFLGNCEKPDVDRITGLTPAIAIEQKTISKNPRSTVGTVTEIYDYLRLLFSRAGNPHCINHHGPIKVTTISQMVKHISNTLVIKTDIKIYAPAVVKQKGQFQATFVKWKREGFYQVLVDKKTYSLDDNIDLVKNQKHSISLLIDEFCFENSQSDQERLSAALETAVNYSNGFVHIQQVGKNQPLIYAQNFSCSKCGYSIPDMEPRFFSFNAANGACNECKGLGTILQVDLNILIPNPDLSINEGGILFYRSIIGTEAMDWKKLVVLCDHFKIDRDLPIQELTDREMEILYYGSKIPLKYWLVSHRTGSRLRVNHEIDGVVNVIKRRFLTTSSHSFHKRMTEKYLVNLKCQRCDGKRLNQHALTVQVNKLNIAQICDLSIDEALTFFQKLVLPTDKQLIAKLILKEILNRLQFMLDVGLSYLTLSRAADTLSGGESQRIRLATQIGSQLTGVLYVLDEPSIGLHQYDNLKLIKTLRSISNLGNTVMVVEHDLETMLAADYIVDLGPRGGNYGGQIMATGTPQQIQANATSLTGQYLSGKKQIHGPTSRRTGNGEWLKICGATENNLQNLDVAIPINCFICVTGLSGSGKSTLIDDVLYHNLKKQFNRYDTEKAGKVKEIINNTSLKKVICITQNPIGKTPRSNPATYTNVFTDIREVYAQTLDAKARGYKLGRFSFNVEIGRCLKCRGDGLIAYSMLFLPDVYIVCGECKGKRFNPATLEIKYKGKTVADVLQMEVSTALIFFAAHIKIARKLQTLADVGLGYLRLGQRSTQLSGGEAQRVKLAAYLTKKVNHSETLYILDEPTTGLHSYDVEILLKMLNFLVDKGATVLVIEHNLDVIKSVDYIIDLGPKGGKHGGKLIVAGTPETIAACKQSYTGQFLKKVMLK